MKKACLFVLAMFGGVAFAAQVACAQDSVDTLAKIKAAKAINVAYSPDSIPFSVKGDRGEPMGYTIDLCKRVITQIGRAVGGPDLKVNWMPGSVGERLQMIASGRADLECANTTPTQSRLATVDFSNLIFLDTGGLLGSGRRDSDFSVWRVENYRRDPRAVLAGSVPLLELAGIVFGGAQFARSASIAAARLARGEGEAGFMRAKIATARHFADHLLVQAPGLRDTIVEGAAGSLALADDEF